MLWGVFLLYKQWTGAYSNSNAIRNELCIISHQWIHKMHENVIASGSCSLNMCWTAVEGFAHWSVNHDSVVLFSFCTYKFIYWSHIFYGSRCVKGARLRALKPREMAHCDVVYPNTECNTVNVVKTFFNGWLLLLLIWLL